MIAYDQYQEVASHYEYVAAQPSQLDMAAKVKQKALQYMNGLEGWCSDYKACFLIDLILASKPKKVVEIGVWGGKSLIPMACALQANGEGIIYGIDPWSPQASSEGMDGVNKEWWSGVNHQLVLDGLLQKIHQFNLDDRIELIRTTSHQASPIYDIGLLHVDGNHSEKTSLQDVNKWVPLVKKGGIIIFDDVTWGTTGKAVQWLDKNCIKVAEVKGDNVWGIWIKP